MRSAFTHWSARRVAGFPTLVSLTPRASVYRSVVTVDSREKEKREDRKREKERQKKKEFRRFSRELL